MQHLLILTAKQEVKEQQFSWSTYVEQVFGLNTVQYQIISIIHLNLNLIELILVAQRGHLHQ